MMSGRCRVQSNDWNSLLWMLSTIQLRSVMEWQLISSLSSRQTLSISLRMALRWFTNCFLSAPASVKKRLRDSTLKMVEPQARHFTRKSQSQVLKVASFIYLLLFAWHLGTVCLSSDFSQQFAMLTIQADQNDHLDSTCLIDDIIELEMSSQEKQEKFLMMNKYTIEYDKLLGKGAMAKVYLGYYMSGEGDRNAKFAVKQISVNSSTMLATDALLQEINLLRKIIHPYILKYIDAKKTKDSLFLFIQYCEKGTLQDFILDHKEQLSQEMIRRFIAQMVIALKFLKDHNIIHRDIKPKNILIHEDGIKISDFGVAKIINNHNSHQETTSFSGTYPFMSPQILRQEKYTFQTDVWSLGITIYFMLFQKMVWKAQKVMGILNEMEDMGDQVVLPPDASISPELRDLLQRMLILDEAARITIEQAVDHVYLRDEIKKLQVEIANKDITYESKEISKIEFMMNSLATSDISTLQLERRSIEVNKNVRASQFTIDLGREAYRKLANHKENILFLKDNLDYLRTCNIKRRIIPEGLFRKCEFLLVKRCYIIAKDLQQIILFGTHVSGNIIIPKKEFTELLEGKNIYLKTLRSEVDRLYEQFKDQWSKTRQYFYSYQRKEGIKMRPREDAYLDHLVESPSLIKAFNDCFLDLFFHFSRPIVENYGKNLSEQIASSTILLSIGVKIEFVYDIMIILCFPNVLKSGTIKNYRDKKKRVPCQEYIYRISIAYKEWKDIWEPLD